MGTLVVARTCSLKSKRHFRRRLRRIHASSSLRHTSASATSYLVAAQAFQKTSRSQHGLKQSPGSATTYTRATMILLSCSATISLVEYDARAQNIAELKC